MSSPTGFGPALKGKSLPRQTSRFLPSRPLRSANWRRWNSFVIIRRCKDVLLSAILVTSGLAPLRLSSAANDFGVTFSDVTRRAGFSTPIVYGGVEQKRYIIETNGCGVAFFDYDNDGWMDVLLLSGTRLEGFSPGKEPTSRLYHNNHNGTFTDVTARSGLNRSGWASAVCVGDYDNDGYDDLFITYYGRNALYHNNGNGTFTDVTEKAGLPVTGVRWGSGCTFIDYDRDGRLDLFVANYLKFDPATVPEPGKGP